MYLRIKISTSIDITFFYLCLWDDFPLIIISILQNINTWSGNIRTPILSETLKLISVFFIWDKIISIVITKIIYI